MHFDFTIVVDCSFNNPVKFTEIKIVDNTVKKKEKAK